MLDIDITYIEHAFQEKINYSATDVLSSNEKNKGF
jgi:hypothetical protein